MNMMNRLLIAVTLLCVHVVRSAHKDRHEQIKRMKTYETAHLEPVMVEDDLMTLSFDAFGEHYEVELRRQTHAAPSNVTHTNVAVEVHTLVSSVEESCHWQGSVLNDKRVSVVSASLCPGRGFRARIAAFNQILIIKPSAYYLDLAKDAKADHSVDDEVLMYRMSDFDRPEITGTEGVSDYVEADDVLMAEGEDMRRRLYSSSSPANTEITVLIGPVRTANYQADYGSNWYSQLYHDTADMMNSVDAVYDATNWNSNGRSSVGYSGSLRVRFNEIHVIYSFTGTYASMAPTKRFSNCPLGSNQYDDSDACAIVGNDWLGLISSWVYYNMQTSNYDNVQFITDIKFNYNTCTSQWSGETYVCSRTLGWGNIGVVCKGSSSVSTNSVVEEFGGNDNAVGTIAHELGHNFGLYHDGQSGPAASCGANDGLMGYGNNHEEFSTCSLDSMRDYYNGGGNGMSCLGSGWSSSDGVTSNVADSGAAVTPSPVYPSSNTPSPVYTPSPVATSASGDCVHIEIGFSNSDGDWQAYSNYEFNGHKAYYFSASGDYYYLIYRDLTWWNVNMKWVIADSWDSNPQVYFFCTAESLMSCGGQWKRWTASSQYVYYPSSSINSQCSSSLNVDTSCASYDCLYVTGTGSFDGYYDASDDCNDGERVFSNSNGEYLCYSGNYNRWFFSDEVCSLSTVISAETSGDAMSPEYWLISSGGSSYTFSSDVYISDCAANGAFTGLECLDNNVYEEQVCVTTNTTLWGGERTFSVYEELCANDQPIYHFVVYNESKSVEFGGTKVSEGVEATLYLHYQPQYLYSTDSEMTPQWMLTRDEISVNYLAKCMAESLMDCTADKWTVKVTEFDEEVLNNTFGGVIQEILDLGMKVSDGACSVGGTQFEDDASSTGTIIAVVVVILVVVLCIVGFCVWRRMNQNDAMKMREQVHGGLPTGTGAEEAEPDVEVATMETGGQITTTQD